MDSPKKNNVEDSDGMPLEGETPLTEIEIRQVRKMMREDDRASWLRKEMKVYVPWMVAMVTALYQLITWVVDHYKR